MRRACSKARPDRRGWRSGPLAASSPDDYAVQPTYGYMNWYVNTDRKLLPSAPAAAFMHVGNGTNAVYVDRDNDVVAVVRWIEGGAMDGFVKRLIAAASKS